MNGHTYHFHKGIAKIVERIYETIKTKLDKNSNISIVGHSLGGALTAIFAIYLLEDGFKNVQAFAICPPPCVDFQGSTKLSNLSAIKSLVVDGDMISLLGEH